MASPERALPQAQPEVVEQDHLIQSLQQNIDGFVHMRQSAQRNLAVALEKGLDENITSPLRSRIETLNNLIQRRRDELKELFGPSA